MEGESLIPKHGGYRGLKSFRMAQLCYDVTVRFCDRYVDRRSRTHDQMVANAALSLLNVACYLLHRQLQAQARRFEEEGGFTERLYRMRSSTRSEEKGSSAGIRGRGSRGRA